MNLPRIFANAFARKIAAFVVAVLLAWLGLGQVRAQDYAQCSNADVTSAYCPDQGSANVAALASADKLVARLNFDATRGGDVANFSVCGSSHVSGRIRYLVGRPANCSAAEVTRYFPSSATCASRPGGEAGMINGTMYSGGVCKDGCKMQPNLVPNSAYTMAESGNSITVAQATWVPSGGTCVVDPSTPAQPEKQNEGCHTTSSGHKVCRGDGKTCIVTASGFRTCANDPNVTGKVATNNPRTEAVAISAPNTPANPPVNRPGENFSQTSNTTVTNNTTGAVTNNSTFNNTGTPNGNQPVPGDGAGNGDDGEGEGEDHGTVSGGQDCTAPPVVSGGNPVENSLLFTAWATRCEGKASDADIAAAEDAADAAMHCAINAGEFCDDPNYLTPEGEVSWLDGDDPLAGSRVVKDLLDVDLDDSGFLGGGSCPSSSAFSVGTANISLSFEPLCNVLINISGFVIAFAYMAAFRIIAGGFR